MRVGVVGGGAVGLVTAGDLAAAGADVTLYERDALGSGATGRAAGICYDAFAGRMDAAVADRALARYREWGLLTPRPYVWVAREDGDGTAVRGQVAEMQRRGVDAETVTPAELGERYPRLRIDAVVAAGVARDAGTVDPDEVVAFLAERARDAGATLRTDTPVSLAAPTTVETAEGTAAFDAVVVAAGHATAPLVERVGVSLAVDTYRAQALVTAAVEGTLPSLYDATREFYWRPRGAGLLVGDGAHPATPDDWDREADASFVEATLDRVRAATTLSPAVERSWAGLCTATPDRDPLVGEVADGLWVATGWQGHGLMRAPAFGEYVARRVRGAPSPFAVPVAERVDPTRFDGDESFDPLGDPTADW
ncbi:NAD(P)/FAD-dependent oxidoreductase [Haloarcula litorea]|uniref:NAD(P)/FAD-dependent oxidoreductase n=1 Tax=Haloarcula litorea TaxID=3032579 RepID=UPI0023E8B094|nr:FAD-dependent oxidoreductase [Halomicroarcula sp. GDY20]